MAIKYTLIFTILGWTSSVLSQKSITLDLIAQLNQLEDDEELVMTYHFVGCFGAYHKGTITMLKEQDNLSFTSRSFDAQAKKYTDQTATRNIYHLTEALHEAGAKKSPEILGNSIHYTFRKEKNIVVKGFAYIDQRHFIELFHPFSSFSNNSGSFKWRTKGITN